MSHAHSSTKSSEIARSRLSQAGYRVTRQRLAVFSFLDGNETHPTVDDIHAGVLNEFPSISLATVYRSVESLVDVGLVKPIHLGHAATRFDAVTEEHGHFRCISCNDIVDVPVDQSPVAKGKLDTFEGLGSTVEFYGFCSTCKDKRAADQPTN